MQDILFYKSLVNGFDYTEQQLELIHSDLKESIDIFAYITNGIWQEHIQDVDWKYNTETLAKKYLVQSSSLVGIFLGTELDFPKLSKKTVLIDLSTIFVNLRALIENYLVLHYLYFEDISEEEKRMRWIIYQLSGIKARRSLSDSNLQYEKKTIILEREKKQEIELLEELKQNPYYQKLSQNTKDYIHKKNLAKVKNWAEIITSSKLNKNNFHKIWKLYSNYAHSEYLSVVQIYDYMANPEETISVRNLTLFFTLTLTCVLIVDFSNMYTELQEYFDRLDGNQKRIINLFYNFGKHAR